VLSLRAARRRARRQDRFAGAPRTGPRVHASKRARRRVRQSAVGAGRGHASVLRVLRAAQAAAGGGPGSPAAGAVGAGAVPIGGAAAGTLGDTGPHRTWHGTLDGDGSVQTASRDVPTLIGPKYAVCGTSHSVAR
jgi:hypothetical protein